MAIRYSEAQRQQIAEHAKGKRVSSLRNEDGDKQSGPYWVMTFEDGSEISFRFMAELV